jgi:acyl-CoA thioesterase FadM
MPQFTYTTEIQTRYRDIDGMGHVNNAVYASYLEAARQGSTRALKRAAGLGDA